MSLNVSTTSDARSRWSPASPSPRGRAPRAPAPRRTARPSTVSALARQYYSCKSVGRGRFVGSTVQNAVSLAASFQHSSDGTSWDNYSTATNASGGRVDRRDRRAGVEAVVEQPVSLVGARRYVRQVLTPTFSGGTSGDSAYFSGVVVFGGADEQPGAVGRTHRRGLWSPDAAPCRWFDDEGSEEARTREYRSEGCDRRVR
jgi:hypothetical protein